MSKPFVGLIMLALALGWAVVLGLVTDGASSLSYLPADDGSAAEITHVRVRSRENAASVVVRLDARDADGDPIEWIDASAVDFFVGNTRVAPDWWQLPAKTPHRLAICIPSSIGVESDRTAEGIREAVLGVLDELDSDNDTASIIVYGDDAKMLQSAAKPNKKFVRSAKDRMQSVKADNGHRVDEAIELAVKETSNAKKRENRTVMVIVEETAPEVVPKLKEFARQTRAAGIALFVIGVNKADAKNDLYSALALLCGGKYEFADSMRQLQRLLREQVRKINSAHHVGLEVDKPLKKDKPLLVQAQVRTPNGSLHDAVFLSDQDDVDWLVPGERVDEQSEPEPISRVEWFFVLGTLAVLCVSLAIPFARLPKRRKKAFATPDEVPIEIPDPSRPQSATQASPAAAAEQVGGKEVDRPLPAPPPAGSSAGAPRRPPPIRRKDDLR